MLRLPAYFDKSGGLYFVCVSMNNTCANFVSPVCCISAMSSEFKALNAFRK